MTVTGTYRLQLHEGFGFADAQAQLPYLASLGVSHLYLSPVLQAVPGSMHGYDVLDHTRVSGDLGGEEGLRALAAAAREHDLGLVVDVVPNHMALVAPESANAPLWAVLREGRDAPTAHWFDIDWKSGGGRLGLPVLGSSLAETLEAGELVLGELDGEPVIRYFEHVFPVALGTEGDDVADVLARQHYQLASWRDTDDDAELPALLRGRPADRRAGRAARRVRGDAPGAARAQPRRHHRRASGSTTPTGWPTPRATSTELREATRPGTLIWVEKILEGDERLPTSWACDGTTGYDAMQAIQAALVDPATAPVLDRAWAQAGGQPDVERSVDASKRQVVDQSLGPEVERLTRRAREALPEQDPERLREAIVELLVAGEVYRAYVHPDQRLSTAGAQADRGRLRRRRRVPARPRARARAADAPGDRSRASGPGRRRLRDPAAADVGTGDGQGHRGHRLLPLAPARRAERGGRRPRRARLAPRRGAARVGRGPAARLAARHDRAVHPRHQAQRGRPGPAARRRR